MKKCTKCHMKKDTIEFYKNGKASECKKCHLAYMKLYRASKNKNTNLEGYGWYDTLWQ